MEIGKAVTHS